MSDENGMGIAYAPPLSAAVDAGRRRQPSKGGGRHGMASFGTPIYIKPDADLQNAGRFVLLRNRTGTVALCRPYHGQGG